VMSAIIKADERVLAEPETLIAVGELGASSVNFVVRPWVKTEDYWAVKFDLTEKIKLAFDENGISIPFPQMDVHLNKVN
jgi:small conductance mechanosensitive channel